MTYDAVAVTTAVASVGLSKMLFVGFDGSHAGAGAKALGVSDVDTDAGEAAPVIYAGIVPVIAGGAVSAGGAVESDADGRAVAHSAGVINGYAIDAASAAGDVIRVKLV